MCYFNFKDFVSISMVCASFVSGSLPVQGGALSPSKRSTSASAMRRATVANAKEPSPKGKWVPPEDSRAASQEVSFC